MSIIAQSPLALSATIVLGALLSEDAATVAAAGLASSGTLNPPLAFASALIGIVVGDTALFAVSRIVSGRASESRLFRRGGQRWRTAAESWFARWGKLVLIATRFVPGTRLPATLAAGALAVPLLSFVALSTVGSVLWIAANFALIASATRRHEIGDSLGIVFAFVIAFVWIFLGRLVSGRTAWVRKIRRWEFWPGWLFYLPVAAICAWLSARHRGMGVAAAANPSQRNGGLVGESKSDILAALEQAAPEYVAPSRLIYPGTTAERMREIVDAISRGVLSLPFILKPDVGQRGAGVRKITMLSEAETYFSQVKGSVIAQQYSPGPHEAGVFYYRFPGEPSGKLLAITEKRFPEMIGDGVRSIGELIKADPRASMIANTYLRRFGEGASRVPAEGEVVPLVESGNHCQGCIFLDGSHLYSEELRRILDQISQAVPGFYVGRYDLRYGSAEELRAGRNFTIIELNGAASEATSIYDPKQSLVSAYRTLYRQWSIVYAIGAENRRRGHQPARLGDLIRDWQAYRRTSAEYPIAS